MNTAFPYSYDQRPYHTFHYEMLSRFHKRCVRIPLNAGFTCPVRDGSLSSNGCSFCGKDGSSTFIDSSLDILTQYQNEYQQAKEKYGEEIYTLPYYQAYTNTYGPLAKIQTLCETFESAPEVKAIIFATRPDCLSKEMISYFAAFQEKKPIFLEFGLQTIHDSTAHWFSRGYDFSCFKDTVEACKAAGLRVCAHFINGFPQESKEQMLESLLMANTLSLDGVKIHMLNIVQDSTLGEAYLQQPFPLLSQQEYIDIVVEQIRHLDPRICIERVTSDPPASSLLAPSWCLDKKKTRNGIDKQMNQNHWFQGDLL